MSDEWQEGKSGTNWEELESYLYEVSGGSVYTFRQIEESRKWVAFITDPHPSRLHAQSEGDTIADALTGAVTAMLTLLHEQAREDE